MTLYGMDAAMIAGVLTAIFTFVAQNMTYVDPVRGSMSAATLRSDRRNRNRKARAILDDPSIGRSKILVIQLQGHLFFGNMAHLTKSINELLAARFDTIDQPLIVIIDFSLVLGIDSSAAQAITKIKSFVRNQFDVKLSIFVTGSQHGFPCAFDLSKELAAHPATPHRHYHVAEETTGLLDLPRVSSHDEVQAMLFCGSHISEDLNMALTYAENFLIARQDPNLLDDSFIVESTVLKKGSSVLDENEVGLRYLVNLCGADKLLVEQLFSRYDREVYLKGEIIWKQGSPSTSVKLLVRGMLLSELENEAGTSELVSAGNSIGELGFVEGVGRMSSVKCISTDAIVYSLTRESYEVLLETAPRAARLIDLICIRYLSARVQHVSNRIFETRCLPI
jgi:SulP family sulfate permease